MQLIVPTLAHLPGFVEALEAGWSPDSLRGAEAARHELQRLREDPARYVELMDDPQGLGPPITRPDGSCVPRLPGIRRWLWDGEFCGQIGLRWQAGTSELPSWCLGHIGYVIVPWKRRRGYATEALRQLLPLAREQGLAWVELTTEPQNLASQQVIRRNAGVLVERFVKDASYGGGESLRYRITLSGG